jgi:hypothetical protein
MVGRRYVLATEKKRSETGDLSKCRMLTRDTIPPPEMVDVFERGLTMNTGFGCAWPVQRVSTSLFQRSWIALGLLVMTLTSPADPAYVEAERN